MTTKPQPGQVIVVGAGPAGLTAAYELSKARVRVTVLEADPIHVGGIARTVDYRGFRFDIGGHRFFSKNQLIENLWSEMLPHGFLVRNRSSRIYYRGKFFSYPLRPLEAMLGLGPLESLACLASFLKARLSSLFHRPAENESLETWVSARFGKRLFQIFFKTYTEKVWGRDCKQISADWASQRIQQLTLGKAVWEAFASPFRRRKHAPIKTLLTSFRYPRLGPGMLWEACAKTVRARGGNILMGATFQSAEYRGGEWQVTYRDAQGKDRVVTGSQLVVSAPLRDVANALSPALPKPLLQQSSKLVYRDFITVGLILKNSKPLTDHWLYIHEPHVKVGRIQNFRAWSPEMVPDADKTSLGLEYFCNQDDELWQMSDEELLRLATKELENLRLAAPGDVLDGCVIRQPKAYPVYDPGYAHRVETLRTALEERFPTLHLVGRNGMHRYNNQDHAMMTAVLTAKNILAGRRLYDVWKVNNDGEYLEAETAKTEEESPPVIEPRVASGRR